MLKSMNIDKDPGKKNTHTLQKCKGHQIVVHSCFNSLPSEKFSPAFSSSAEFFQNQLIGEILSRIPSECQIDCIQIRPDILSGLIWVQTVFAKVISRRH